MGLDAIARAGGIDRPADAGPPIHTGSIAQVRAYRGRRGGGEVSSQPRWSARVGALAFDGWDTHVNEGAINGSLAALLGVPDGAIAAYALCSRDC